METRGVEASLALLLGLLDQIAKEDSGKVFEYPVDGAAVPGYYERIKAPMCLQTMRERVAARQYRTWRAFVRDFELICENAKTFNQPQHRVHKLAINLQRHGRKILQTHELPGRRALHALHPDGPRAAAADEESAIRAAREEARTASLLLQASSSGDLGGVAANAAGGGGATTTKGEVGASQGAAAATAPAAGHHQQTMKPPTAPRAAPEDLARAAQLWDMPALDAPSGTGLVGSVLAPGGDWGLLFRELPEKSVDGLAGALRVPALHQPYRRRSRQQQRRQPADAAAPAAAAAAAAAAGTATTLTAAVSVPPTAAAAAAAAVSQDWRATAQPVLWRCRWLHARVQELGSMIGLLQAPGTTLSLAGGCAEDSSGASPPPETPGAGGAGGGGGGISAPGDTTTDCGGPLLQVQRGGRLLRQHLRAVGDPALIRRSPFFAARAADGGQAGSSLPPPAPPPLRPRRNGATTTACAAQQLQEQQLQQQKGEGSGETCATPHASTAMDVDEAGGEGAAERPPQLRGGTAARRRRQPANTAAAATVSGTRDAAAVGEADATSAAPGAGGPSRRTGAAAAGATSAAGRRGHERDAALVFSGLEVVEAQLVAARVALSRAFGIEASLAPAGVRLGAHASGRLLGGGSGSMAGHKRGGLGLTRGGSGGFGGRPGQLGGSSSIKRRRVERSGLGAIAGSVDADDGVLSPSASLPARLLLERAATSIHIPSVREIAPDEWSARQAAATAWRSALCAQGVRSALARPPPEVRRVLEAAAMEEGSSSEDTSDEAYARLHAPLEEEEHVRLCGLPGGARKRKQNKTSAGGQQPAAAAGMPKQQQQQPPAQTGAGGAQRLTTPFAERPQQQQQMQRDLDASTVDRTRSGSGPAGAALARRPSRQGSGGSGPAAPVSSSAAAAALLPTSSATQQQMQQLVPPAQQQAGGQGAAAAVGSQLQQRQAGGGSAGGGAGAGSLEGGRANGAHSSASATAAVLLGKKEELPLKQRSKSPAAGQRGGANGTAAVRPEGSGSPGIASTTRRSSAAAAAAGSVASKAARSRRPAAAPASQPAAARPKPRSR